MLGDDGSEWHQTIILPDEVLNNSPSSRYGVSQEDEVQQRIFGCELIQEANILLKSPQVVAATGQNLLQRFFYRHAMTNDKPTKHFLCDAFSVAMGCLFLACKIEEHPKRPRELVFVFHRMALRRKGLPPEILDCVGKGYNVMKGVLFDVERVILKELGFSFYNIMDHPHKFILYYIKILDDKGELAQRAWNYINDSLRLDCCVRYRAELVACAAIYMAARDLQVKLPVSPPWWELFGATLSEIKQVGNYILSLYSQPRLQWLEPVHPMAMVAEGEFHKLLRSPVPPAGGSTYPGAGTGGGSGNVTAAASPAGAMLPPSPVVVLSAAEDTPGAASKAKPEKTPERGSRAASDVDEEKGGLDVDTSIRGSAEEPGASTKSPSMDARSDRSLSTDRRRRSTTRSRSPRKKSRSRSPSRRSRSPTRKKDRDSRDRRRDRSRSRDRDRDRRDRRDREKDRGRRRDRSRSRDRGRRR